MNLKARLLHLAEKLNNPRAYGKTTLLAKITKELDGVLLTHNTDEATRVQRAYGITAKSIDINLDGFSGPFFLDNHAAMRLLQRAAAKIEDLEKENEKMRSILNNISELSSSYGNRTSGDDKWLG